MNDYFLQFILFFYNTIGFKNIGLSIIEIAIVTRIVFYPMLKQQLQSSKKIAELKPHLDALNAKHKDNKMALQQAQMDLYKQHGVNPAAGCLPLIVQIVVMYGLLGGLNKALAMNLNTSFFIWDMAKPDAYKIAGLSFAIPGLLVVITAITQYVQSMMMMPVPPKVLKVDKPKEKEEKVDFATSYAESMQASMWMFPLMFLVFGVSWPSGLALYWSVGSILSIAQQYPITGLGSLAPTVAKVKAWMRRGR
jgi:YidC/Oxa1 family membrane protein insertase